MISSFQIPEATPKHLWQRLSLAQTLWEDYHHLLTKGVCAERCFRFACSFLSVTMAVQVRWDLNRAATYSPTMHETTA